MAELLRALVAVATVVNLSACGTDGGKGEPPLFPADYAATYQEVRECRNSIEHDLMRIRVLASPEALAVYTGRNAPFPAGAIVLKEQYDDSDTDCAGPVLTYTVMQKLDAGSSSETIDWMWQEVDGDLRVQDTDVERCVSCHTRCGGPPFGYEGTCTEP